MAPREEPSTSGWQWPGPFGMPTVPAFGVLALPPPPLPFNIQVRTSLLAFQASFGQFVRIGRLEGFEAAVPAPYKWFFLCQ